MLIQATNVSIEFSVKLTLLNRAKVAVLSQVIAKVMGMGHVGFYGNVKVGVDVKVDDLGDLYDVLIFTHGSPQDQKLGIPGEGHLATFWPLGVLWAFTTDCRMMHI